VTSEVVITDNDNDVDSTPPTVSITSPAVGTAYTSVQTVSIAASAQDNVGVSKVEFYKTAFSRVLFGRPYKYNWAVTATDNGSHSFTAKAYDAAGNQASSVAVNLSVKIPATVVGPPKVFPGAVGFGTDTPAGRGGQIIKSPISTTAGPARSGPPSLHGSPHYRVRSRRRDQPAERPEDHQRLLHHRGQTAPGNGIMLKGYGLRISASDVLVQHIAIRVGDDGRTAGSGQRRLLPDHRYHSHNIVIDHVSLSWGSTRMPASGPPMPMTLPSATISSRKAW